MRRLPAGGWLRVGAHAAWMAALTAWATLDVARYGFNPTDQGFILAASRRILEGQVPNVDFVSPRPLGSALIHTIDFALPGPLFLMSDALTVLEFVLAAAALTALLLRRPIRSLGPAAAGLAAAVALIDLHTFPVSAWHTVDGTALVVFGWLLIDAGMRAGARTPSARRAVLLRRGGLLLVGFAALCKQSFVPAAPVALVLLLAHPVVRRGQGAGRVRGRGLAADVAVLVVPGVVYAAAVTAAGGLPGALRQLTGAQSAWGGTLLAHFWGDLRYDATTTSLFVVGALSGIVAVAIRSRSLPPAAAALPIAPAFALVGTVCVGAILVHGNLVRPAQSRPDWASALFWMLVAVAVAEAVLRREWRRPSFLVVVLAWMVSLSWGYDTPELVAGMIALAYLAVLWRGTAWTAMAPSGIVPPGPARLALACVAGLALLLPSAALLLHARADDTYRDKPRSRLSYDLGVISPTLHGIRAGQGVLVYLEQIKSCVAAHPARSIAVLPDNAAIYPALNLNDPLPADWIFSPELDGNGKQRVLDAMRALNSSGHYLVMFETTPADTLATHTPAAAIAPGTPLFEYGGQYATNPPLDAELRAELHGVQVPCGSFVAVWSK